MGIKRRIRRWRARRRHLLKLELRNAIRNLQHLAQELEDCVRDGHGRFSDLTIEVDFWSRRTERLARKLRIPEFA